MIARRPAGIATLGNGLRLVAQAGVAPPVTAVSVFLPTGHRDDPAGLAGLAHFTVGMLRRGARGADAFELARACDAAGVDLSVSAAADYLTLGMKCLTRHRDRALDLLVRMLAPAFPAAQMRAARREWLEEIRAERDDAASVCDRICRAGALAGTPYARGRIGSAAEARGIGRDRMNAFWYGRALRPAEMLVSAAADRPVGETLAALSAAFAPLRAEAVGPPPPASAPAPPAAAPPAVYRAMGRDQVVLQFGFPAPAVDDPDYIATILLATLLGDGMGFRLGRLRESTGIAYVLYAHYEAFLGGGFFKIQLGTSPARVGEALDRLGAEMADLASRPSAGREWDLVRARTVGQFLQSFETSRERAHYTGFFERFLGDRDRFYEQIEAVRTIAPEAVAACARRIFGGRRFLALVGPAAARRACLRACSAREG